MNYVAIWYAWLEKREKNKVNIPLQDKDKQRIFFETEAMFLDVWLIKRWKYITSSWLADW